MSDKDLLRALGLNDRTLTLGFNDEYARIIIEKRIDDYLHKLEEEKKKEDLIGRLKNGHEEFKEKEHLVEMLESKYVKNKLRRIMLDLGAPLNCPHCLYDGAGLYGKYAKPTCKNKE